MANRMKIALALIAALYSNEICAQNATGLFRWHVGVYGFGIKYDNQIGYEPGWGGGFIFGHTISNKNIHIATGFDYSLAEQKLLLVNGTVSSFVRFYSWHNAVGKQFPFSARFSAQTQIFATLVFLSPRPVTIPTADLSELIIYSKSEVKFSPGFAFGFSLKALRNMAVDLQLSSHLLRFRKKMLFSAENEQVWKPHWRINFGLAYLY